MPSYTILLVDDHQELLDVIGDLLQALGGFTVYTAHNGVEGLVQYEAIHPDCVIIDVRMPQIDGYQLVRILRGDPASAQTPLIILSALGQDRDKWGGMLSGADFYLIKPVLPSELIATIHEAISLTQEQRNEAIRHIAEDFK